MSWVRQTVATALLIIGVVLMSQGSSGLAFIIGGACLGSFVGVIGKVR